MCCVKSDKSRAGIWRDFNLFGPPHVLMSGSLAKYNFVTSAKSEGKYHNQTYIINSIHLWSSQDYPSHPWNCSARLDEALGNLI